MHMSLFSQVKTWPAYVRIVTFISLLKSFDEFEDFRISTKETTQHALDTFAFENKSNTDETDADVVLNVELASTDTKQQQNETSWGPKIYMTENHPLKLMVQLLT